MGSEWREVTLNEVLETIIDYRGKTPPKSDTGIPVLTAASVKNGRVLKDKVSFISHETYSKVTTRGFPKVGDVLVTTEAPCGEVAPFPTDQVYHITRRIMALRGNTEKITSEFLLYVLMSDVCQNQLYGKVRGTTVPRVLKTDITGLKFLIPTVLEQKKIGDFLASIDKKIELNRQINQTLEQMAQALFQSWFIDFDPVIDNALDAETAIPAALEPRAQRRRAVRAAPGFTPLPDEIRRLFPSTFVESPDPSAGLSGWVPEGWELQSVSHAIQINPKVKLLKGEEAKFVEMKSLPTTGYSIDEVLYKPFSGGAKFEREDVLLARITPCLQNGKTGFVDFLDENEIGFGSTEFIVMRQTKAIHYGYIACLARNEKFRQHAMQSMVGSSGRQRVQNSCFDSFYISVPTESIMNLFSEMMESYFIKMTVNKHESNQLEALRDTLLPKLISGELRLDFAEVK